MTDCMVAEGDTCDRCGRRVPHKRKVSSPSSVVKGMRMPAEDGETFDETLEAVAGHLGVATSEKFWKFKASLLAYALVLQTSARVIADSIAGRGE